MLCILTGVGSITSVQQWNDLNLKLLSKQEMTDYVNNHTENKQN